MTTDLKRAARALLRSPAYTFAAIATFAIGIGANATVFGVVNAVLLRAFPFREPERLVALYEYNARGAGNDRFPLSPANFRDWRDGQRSFAGLSLVDPGPFTLRSGAEPERLNGARVSGNFVSVLGTPLAAGRGFLESEDVPGAAPVAIISHALWQRAFGGDRSLIGRAVEINGRPTTIVGVLPADFRFPSADRADIIAPLAWSESDWRPRGAHWLTAVGRLKNGVSVRSAQADLQTIADRIGRDFTIQKGWGARVVPLHEAIVSNARPMLLVLMGAVGAVLLIGCANVANLTLARVAAKQRATAVRAAIGAGRGELVRQHLAESVVLGIAGGAAGLALASAVSRMLPRVVPSEIPRIADAGVDWRVALFTFGISLAASVIAGLVPAWQGSRADLAEVLRDGNKGSTSGAARARSRDLLFVAEVALSLLLLAGAGLALKSFTKLLAVDTGFAAERVLVGRVSLPAARYADSLAQNRFWDGALQRLRAVPGVHAASTINFLPLGGDEAFGAFGIAGRPLPEGQHRMAQFLWATEGYFDAMGIPLRRGRALTGADRENSPLVAVVNEALVKQQFPGEDPLGQQVQPFGSDGPSFRIVGVVGNVKHRTLTDSLRGQIYFPTRQLGSDAGWFVVRGTGDAESLSATLRREVHAVDPTIAVADVQPMQGVVATSIARQRFLAQLLGGFAASALVLALVGIYGVVANTVVQRSSEFGIRVALGATSTNVLSDVLGASLVRTGLGLAVGLVAALAAGRTLSAQLYEVKPNDPLVLGAIAAMLVAVALLASWWPARRATRVDPMRVLRSE